MGRFGRRRMEQSDRGDSSAVNQGPLAPQLRVRIPSGVLKSGSPVWTRLELAKGAQDNFRLARDPGGHLSGEGVLPGQVAGHATRHFRINRSLVV